MRDTIDMTKFRKLDRIEVRVECALEVLWDGDGFTKEELTVVKNLTRDRKRPEPRTPVRSLLNALPMTSRPLDWSGESSIDNDNDENIEANPARNDAHCSLSVLRGKSTARPLQNLLTGKNIMRRLEAEGLPPIDDDDQDFSRAERGLPEKQSSQPQPEETEVYSNELVDHVAVSGSLRPSSLADHIRSEHHERPYRDQPHRTSIPVNPDLGVVIFQIDSMSDDQIPQGGEDEDSENAILELDSKIRSSIDPPLDQVMATRLCLKISPKYVWKSISVVCTQRS